MLPTNFHDSHVTIIGLGYVGLTLAVAMADAGFRVHGVERDQHVLACLKDKKAHFSEVGLNDRLQIQIDRGRLTFSQSLEESASTVFIVTVGTPVGANKRTKFEALQQVIGSIAGVLTDGDLVVLRSTVRVGTTTEVVKPILDATGKTYDLAFCPERTLEGKALLELRTLPQIVGGVTERSTFRASQVFSFLTPSIVRVSNAETAEVVKLVNNTQRDYVFAFANEVAAVADAIGISAHEVIASGNLGYPRANLPFPGPVGGPCLEKDPYILAEGLERFGFTPTLALAGRHYNEELPVRTIEMVARSLATAGVANPPRIAVTGLAFKGRPETDDMRGSLVIQVIEAIRRKFPKAELVGWDPIVKKAEVEKLGLTFKSTVDEVFTGSSLVIIQNNHEFFARANLTALSHLMAAPGIIYDYWNSQSALDQADLAKDIHYRALGTFNVQSARSEAQ